MGEVHSDVKRTREIRCACIDERTLSPQNRAHKLFEALQKVDKDLDNYDIICFAVLFLAGQLAVEPDFAQEVKSLALKLHYNHYFKGGGIGLYDEEAITKLTELRLAVEQNKTGDKIKE